MSMNKKGRTLGRPKANETDTPTNEVILQKAAYLFLEKGYQKVSIDVVAIEAGVTKATVYYYFGSKAELYKGAMVSLMLRIRDRIDTLMKSNKPLYERLFDVTMAHLQATTTLNLESFMQDSKSDLTIEQIQEIKNTEENMYESIEQAFQIAMVSGEIPQINVKFATHAYLALIRVGNYKQPDGSSLFTSIQDSAESILQVFWKGFFGNQPPFDS
jgi:AcrR family transcriptional regulator